MCPTFGEAKVENQKPPRVARKRTRDTTLWVSNLLMLALGIVIGFTAHWLWVSTAASAPASPIDALVKQTRHFKGNANAPVTIIEISDFQCPYCGRFATGTARQIEETYIKTGVVRFGYQHMAFLGVESRWAAEASECAAEQGKFWEYHDKLFASQSGENRGAFNKENLKNFAADLRLDTAKFNACLDSGKFTSLVEKETANVQSLGVQSTPSFLINGQPLAGAQPFEAFQRIIETERAKKK